MHLRIKPDNITLWSNYENHNSYHLGDSGLDLFTPEDIIVPAGAISFKVDLRIQCEAYSDKNKSLSISYYLYPRSSMGAKSPLRLANSVGIIDAGYRGEIKAIVDNLDREKVFVVRAGTRLLQLCSPILSPITYEMANSLSDTNRGNDGFGSTGQ